MGMYLFINTKSNEIAALETEILGYTPVEDKIKREIDVVLESKILGYTPADAKIVSEIEARYRPILDEQMRADWHEQYAAYNRELTATPELSVAQMYETYGFGKIQAWKAVDHITANQGCGSCDGALAVRVLIAQREHFDVSQCPSDAYLLLALERAIVAARDGLIGVCWG